MKPTFVYYSTIASNKINIYKQTFTFSSEEWNAYSELLALREYARNINKNNERKLYNKMYNKFINSGKFGLALATEHAILKSNPWA